LPGPRGAGRATAFELVERSAVEPSPFVAPGIPPSGRAHAELASLDTDEIAILARAFSIYFQLVNLAEERSGSASSGAVRAPRARAPRRFTR